MSKQVVSISDAVPYQEFAKLIGKTPAAVRGEPPRESWRLNSLRKR